MTQTKSTTRQIKENNSEKSGGQWANSEAMLNKSITSNTWPRISVITPSYNQAEYLVETIQSVLGQRYPNLEYMIIDGGSSDGSVEIIKKYESWLAYWVSEEDRGQSDAINKGFKRATGEIVAWLNSDDCYLPDTFINVASIFSKQTTVDLIYGDVQLIDRSSEVIKNIRTYGEISDFFLWTEGRGLTNQTVFWRRNLFDKIGYLREDLDFIIDYEFFLRARLVSNFSYCPKLLAQFRIHPESKTTNLEELRLKEHIQISKEYWKRIKKYAPANYWFKVNDKYGRFKLSQAIRTKNISSRNIIEAIYLAPGLLKEFWVIKILLRSILDTSHNKLKFHA